jgi:uncharacterized protein with GYD domain
MLPESATSGEQAAEAMRDEEASEESGGPFVAGNEPHPPLTRKSTWSGASIGIQHWHAGTATQGVQMATYITLMKYTEQGLKTIKESPSRLEKAKQLLKSLGGELKSFHLVQGRYDAIVISEAPNDEAVTKFALATGSLGNVRTETLRAFTESEYRKIVSALP